MNGNINVDIKLKKYHEDKVSDTTGIQIQVHHWFGNKKPPMEDIDLYLLPNRHQ